MAARQPEDDSSDASSTTTEFSSVNELPFDGVPLQYPSPRNDEVPRGTVYGQLSFPQPIAPQGVIVTPQPVALPTVTTCPPGKDAPREDIEMGKPSDIRIPVVVPRLALDTLKGRYPEPIAKPKGSDSDVRLLPEFQDRTVRIRFFQKVIWIVVVQLAMAAGLSAATIFADPVKEFVKDSPWLIYSSWGVGMPLIIVGACFFDAIRQPPGNVFFFLAFTAAMPVMVASLVGFTQCELAFLTVGLAFALMAVMALIVTLLSVDVTSWVPLMVSSCLIVFGAAVGGAFYFGAVFSIVVAAAGAMTFSIYVVYDIQLLLGDTKKYLSPKEYMIGALSIYLDITSIFTGVLRTCKRKDRI